MKTEELAKELRDNSVLDQKHTWEQLPDWQRARWIGIATHVNLLIQKEVLRARISQCGEGRLEDWEIAEVGNNPKAEGFILGSKRAISHHQEWCDKEIKDLQRQLSELERIN